MQKKTINLIIRKKLELWLSTITDEKLRKEVKECLLVSGGSIASMFLNEKVNDYDIYLSDINVLMKLAKYYCPYYEIADGRLRDAIIKEKFPMIEEWGGMMNAFSDDESTEKYQSRDYVFYKNLRDNQVKLNCLSQGVKFDVSNVEPNKFVPVFLSQNAISLTDDIQIVLRFSGPVEEIHKTFDFMHATNYFIFKEGLVTNLAALESIISKDLKYQGSFYPLTSIIRMKKFLKRGWVINAGEILKIMFQISELNLRDLEVLEEQLIGVDVAYFSTLIAILKGVKTEHITSFYLNEIIDKVFNAHEDKEDEDLLTKLGDV